MQTESGAELGGCMFQWCAPTAALPVLFSVTATMGQGIDRQRAAVGAGLLGALFPLTCGYCIALRNTAAASLSRVACIPLCALLWESRLGNEGWARRHLSRHPGAR